MCRLQLPSNTRCKDLLITNTGDQEEKEVRQSVVCRGAPTLAIYRQDIEML